MAADPGRAAPRMSANDLGFSWPGSAFRLEGVNLTFPPSSFTVVLGQNGSGKSTLVRLLGGLLAPTCGTATIDDRPVTSMTPKERGRVIAFVSQDEPRELPFTALDVVLMGRYAHQGWWPFDSRRDLEIAHRSLERCDAGAFASRSLDRLSGGERQRVFLARALAQEPRILLLDEPASSLDLLHQVELYRVLRDLNRNDGLTVVAVSHEVNLATTWATQIVLLKAGAVMRAGPVDDVMVAKDIAATYDVDVASLEDSDRPRPVFVPRP